MDEVSFQDKLIVCCDCQEEFLLTTGEAEFFHDKGLKEPRRCPECRRQRRERPDNR